MEPIILASASPRRKELLQQVRVPFVVKPSSVDEELKGLYGSPVWIAENLARLKAEDVAKDICMGLVLGADTIVVLEDEIFGKPKDRAQALDMLEKLNGREHCVITGLALIDSASGMTRIGHETTRVRFANVSPEAIQNYINTGEPEGKAGAYAVQGLGAMLVESINGCYNNVVGLPLHRLGKMMEEYGIYIMQEY